MTRAKREKSACVEICFQQIPCSLTRGWNMMNGDPARLLSVPSTATSRFRQPVNTVWHVSLSRLILIPSSYKEISIFRISHPDCGNKRVLQRSLETNGDRMDRMQIKEQPRVFAGLFWTFSHVYDSWLMNPSVGTIYGESHRYSSFDTLQSILGKAIGMSGKLSNARYLLLSITYSTGNLLM